MTRFISTRLLQMIVVIAIMSFVIYALIGLMPGDPIDLMISSNPRLSPADALRLKALYGLDKPLIERYFAWARAALPGDFGYSRLYLQPVLTVLRAAARQHRAADGREPLLRLCTGAAARHHRRAPARLGDRRRRQSRLLRRHFRAVLLAGADADPRLRREAWDGCRRAASRRSAMAASPIECSHLVLPVATLTLVSMGRHLRYIRAAMIETLRQDYIRTARAKGAGESRVLVGHALRNALIPVVTVLALSFGNLFSGALITETMFAYPGMGKLIYDAILGNDFNLALAGLLLATVMVLVGNLAADIAYAAIDPRIAYAMKRWRDASP